jgi:hypothetical protein
MKLQPHSMAEPLDPHEQVRCLCGQLVARLVEGGIELKCKRCRRLVTIPLSRIRGTPRGNP